VLAMTGPEEEREFRLGWSLWRRAHQAVAGRCHRARRRATRPTAQSPEAHPLGCAMEQAAHGGVPRAPLTDAEWERVRPLLPPQKPRVGRPRRDQRVVVDAIMWVLGTGSSWRDVPRERYGPWETIYGRYSEWRKDGRWQRVLETLRFENASRSAAEVSL
jgi:transposase